jgi:hypothetical protein
MKKDIEFPEVEGIKVVIARQFNEQNESLWDVFLLNRLTHKVDTVLVTARGYGIDSLGSAIKTAEVRYFFKELAANEIVKIEPITPDVFGINNEYWVSYYIGNQIFDKKFIFVPDSIREEYLIKIDKSDLEGILHE